jgi:hypothetical protein
MPRLSKTDTRQRYKALQRGIRKHWRDGLTAKGKSYTQKQLLDALDRVLAAFERTRQAWATYKKELGLRREEERHIASLVNLILEGVHYFHDGDPVTLADFEVRQPRKKGPKTVMAKVQMVVRAKETRRLRGTLGPKQRKKIRGW